MLKEEWFNHDTNSNSLQNYQHFDADKDKEDLEGDDEEYPSRHKREDMKEAKLTKDDLIHKVLDGALLDPKSGQNKASVDGILHHIKKAGVKGITKGDIIKHAKSMNGIKVQGGTILKDIKEETMNEGPKWNATLVQYQSHLSSSEYEKVKKLKWFNAKNYKWNPKTQLYDKVNEMNEGKVLKEYTDKNFNKDSIAGFKPDLKVLKKFFPKSVRSSKAYKRFTKYEGGEMWVHVAYSEFKHNGENLSVHWKQFYLRKEPVNLTLMWLRNRDTDTNYGALLVDTDTFYKEKKQIHETNEMKEAKKSTQMKQFDKKVDAKLIANRMRNNKSKSAKSFQLNVFADKVSKMGKVSERDIDNLLPDYIPGGLIASLFTESVNEIKNKFDIQKTFGKDVHAIKKTKEGNFIVQGNLDKIRKTAEKNNINIEDVENWGVRIWTESIVTEGKTSAVYTDPKTGKGYDLQYVSSKKRWELDVMKKGASIYSSAITTIKRDTLAEIQEWLDGYKIDSSWTKGLSESVNEAGNFAGWIAGFNGKKIEIKKGEAKDLWGAKQLAVKQLKVPKSKMGLLWIKPAVDESVNESKKSVTVISNGLQKLSVEMKKHAEFYVKAKAKGDAKEMKQHIGHLKTLTSQKKELERGLDAAISDLDKDVELVANEHVVRSQIRNLVRESLVTEGKFTDDMNDAAVEVYVRFSKITGAFNKIQDYKPLEVALKKDKKWKALEPYQQRLVHKALQWKITHSWEMER
jgi:hypothetical protein